MADAACFQAVDQLVKLLFFGPVSGERAVLNGELSETNAQDCRAQSVKAVKVQVSSTRQQRESWP